ncbi:hypothetical protein EIP86_004288 [Pleurotus ostreatoroseus]|nr:hypothetical protein EIP86_004288 [Pleurotus ostreatoroseus]
MSRHDRHDFRRIYGTFSPYPPRRGRSNTVPGPSVHKSTDISPSAPVAGCGETSMEVVEPYSPVVGLHDQERPSTPPRGNRALPVVPLTPTIYHRDRDPRVRVKAESLPASPMKIDPATPRKDLSIEERPTAGELLPSARSTVEPGEIRASEVPQEQPTTPLGKGKGPATPGFWDIPGGPSSYTDTDIAMTSPMAQSNASLPPPAPEKVASMSLMQLLEAARQPSPPQADPSIWSADCPTPRVPDAGEKLPLFFPSLSPSPGPRATPTPGSAKSYEDSVAREADLNAVYNFLESLDKPLAHHWGKFTTAGINKEVDLDVLADLPPGCEKYLDDIYKQLQEKGVSAMDWIHVVRGLQNRRASTSGASPSKSTRGSLR